MIIYKKRCNPEDIHSHHLRRSLITNTKGVGIFLNTQIFFRKVWTLTEISRELYLIGLDKDLEDELKTESERDD